MKKVTATLAFHHPRREGLVANVPWYLIQPNSRFKVGWDTLAIVLLVYTVVIVPVRIGFEIEDFCPSGIWWWETFIDVAFLIDLGLNFVTAIYIDEALPPGSPARSHFGGGNQQALETSLAKIAVAYLKSWFIIDLVSSVPIDTVMGLSVHGCIGRAISTAEADQAADLSFLRMVRIVRLVKLLKILRVLKLQSRLDDLGDKFPWLTNTVIFSLMRTMSIALYGGHLLACGFYLVGSSSYYDAAAPSEDGAVRQAWSWLLTAGLELKEEPGLAWSELGAPYTACMYWTFTTITTVGYGDLTPISISERWYAIMTMICGTGLFGYLLGVLTHIMADSHGQKAQLRLKLLGLQSFMDGKSLPYALQVRMRRHFRYYWKRALTADMAEDDLMRQLSPPLRQEVLRIMYRAVIADVHIFSYLLDSTFHNELLRVMRPLLISPEETLITQGMSASEMYLVSSGTLKVWYSRKVAKAVETMLLRRSDSSGAQAAAGAAVTDEQEKGSNAHVQIPTEPQERAEPHRTPRNPAEPCRTPPNLAEPRPTLAEPHRPSGGRGARRDRWAGRARRRAHAARAGGLRSRAGRTRQRPVAALGHRAGGHAL